MLSPSLISDWLQQPRPLTPAEAEAVDSLLRDYPYFLPAHYMDAAEQYRKNPSPSPLQAMTQLYLGNWAFFHGILQAAQGTAKSTKAPRAAVPEPEAEDTPADAAEETPVLANEGEEDDAPAPEETEIDWAPEGLEAAVLETHHLENTGLAVEEEDALQPHPHAAPEPEPAADEPASEPEDGGNAVGPDAIEDAVHPEDAVLPEDTQPEAVEPEHDYVIRPFFTEDYFRHQGIDVSEELPQEEEPAPGADLMVMRSFMDWLLHFRRKKEEAREEDEGRKALKAHWQKEKLAAALEEEDDEIPEAVFEMAVSSIRQEEPLVSESMASVYLKQGKWDKAIAVYRRLQSANPAKSAYFAAKIAAAEQQKSSWSS